MASSSNSGSDSRCRYIRYANLRCKCRCLSDIKVSMSKTNPNRLFYSCKNDRCVWLGWCEPLPDEDDVEIIVDPEINDDYADANMGDLEDEIDNVKKQVEGLTEAIQEEVAAVKLEFDNGIADLKKDLVEKLIVSENGFNEELLILKTEVETMKQTIGNLKLALFGMMLVLVMLFYGYLT
ncbi:hypothetical protein P8452_42901 [Trifolium repens]|nr:hypothetical protein P8452_42901 [Trifolium repens]